MLSQRLEQHNKQNNPTKVTARTCSEPEAAKGYYCKVEFDLTSDGKTRVCYHPSVDVPYEHKKPIPGSDPVHNNEETQDQVQKKTDEKEKCLDKPESIYLKVNSSQPEGHDVS
eukprot:bmy_21888T0